MNAKTLEAITSKQSVLVKDQKKIFGPVFYKEHGKTYSIKATVRYDDQCNNGHNSFAITADIRSGGRHVAGGCCHDEVAKHLPRLAPLIKWHLCDSGGPMYYIENTRYHASERDHDGLLKGEFRQHASRGKYQNGGIAGVPNWELCIPDEVKTDVYSEAKPAPVTLEWRPCGITGKGKERNLSAARACAIWPEATDEELTAPGLEERLKARLPKLMEEFIAAVESLGFTY